MLVDISLLLGLSLLLDVSLLLDLGLLLDLSLLLDQILLVYKILLVDRILLVDKSLSSGRKMWNYSLLAITKFSFNKIIFKFKLHFITHIISIKSILHLVMIIVLKYNIFPWIIFLKVFLIYRFYQDDFRSKLFEIYAFQYLFFEIFNIYWHEINIFEIIFFQYVSSCSYLNRKNMNCGVSLRCIK